jgi:hypothetical protein
MLHYRADLRQGSSEATPGSSCTTAMVLLSSHMAEGRPLPPQSSATVSSGRRLMAFLNLQAGMPLRRPLCTGAAYSRRLIPSGFVPGDVSVGCVGMLQLGGEGAGLDCVL